MACVLNFLYNIILTFLSDRLVETMLIILDTCSSHMAGSHLNGGWGQRKNRKSLRGNLKAVQLH